MNVDHIQRTHWWHLAILAVFGLGPATYGQTKSTDTSSATESPPRKEEPVMLSPFEVSSETEHGYQSTAVLQGGRGRIELADLAAQVSVFTKQFLDDIGATSIDEAYLFSATTQTYYDQVDGNGGNVSGSRVSPTSVLTNDAINSRGLGSLNYTRNFFRTAIDTDSYNTERLSLINGANAVQFGLGGPAGTSESTSVRANLSQNRQRTKLSMDSYGSQRGEIDISQVIFKNKLAVRAIGLRDNKEYFLRPGYEEARRGFVTTTYQPFKGTVLRMEGEYAYRRDARPSTIMTRDVGYMSWLASKATGNPQAYANVAATAGAVGRPPVPSFGLADGTVRTYGLQTNNALFIFPQNSTPAFAGLQDVRNTVVAPMGNGDQTAGATQSLIVAGYPWDVNPSGFSRYNRRRSRNLQATFEQRLAPNTFLEVGCSWEFFRNNSSQFMANNGNDVLVDINRFLPDGVTPNPLYGRAFMQSNGQSGQGSWTDNRIMQYRAALMHEQDFTHSTGFARHLGRHKLGLYVSHDDTSTYNLGNNQFMILGKPSFLSQAAKDNPLDATRKFNVRFYLPPIGSTSDPFAYAMPNLSAYGDIMGTMNFTTPSGEPFQVSEFQNPIGFVGATPTASHLQRGSGAASTSSSFLANNLVVNIGVRHDLVRNSDFAAFTPLLSSPGVAYMAFPDFRTQIPADVWTPWRSVTRLNYGFVVRPPRIGKWLTLGYDFSKNATLNEVAVVKDVTGAVVEPGYGESHEYSVRLRLLQDRLNLKLNYFNALSRNTALADSSLRQNLINFEQQLYRNDPTYAINPLFNPALNPLAANFRLPSDLNSKGVEVDLTFNPNRDWRIFGNLGRTDTKLDAISSQPWFDYINAKLPGWERIQGNWATATYASNQTVQSAYTSLIATSLENIQASLGTRGGNSQTWRSSLIVTRSFTTGRLKGAAASVNFRYRGPSLIGFPNRIDSLGRVQPDRDHPYKSEGFILTGLMANYQFHGFGKTSWRVQLNANNIFNTQRLYLTRTFPDGTPRNYGRQPGRGFILSMEAEH